MTLEHPAGTIGCHTAADPFRVPWAAEYRAIPAKL